MGSFCYMASLTARGGAFTAVQKLSPDAHSRSAFLFDLPRPTLNEGETVDRELDKRAEGIAQCARLGGRVYFDVHDYPPELTTGTGLQPIEYLAERLHQNGAGCVPVTGTIEDRGRAYVETVRNIVDAESGGVCLRLARDELEEPAFLESAINATLDALGITPGRTDVVMNFAFVGDDKPERLRTVTRDALDAITRIGSFRNIVLSGTSIPAQLGKRTKGEVLRFRRVEFDVWADVSRMLAGTRGVAFGDHGIVEIHHTAPGKIVNVPSRIRYTTRHDHVIRRAARGDYHLLCRELVNSKDFMGKNFSVGDQQFATVAMADAGKFSPGLAVAHDANHHIEFVSGQTWQHIQECGGERMFALPKLASRAWMPQLLDIEVS